MDKLDQYRVFAQVAEMRSFAKAADALLLPRASVSAAVQQLEAALGAGLLPRTTRQVQLTPDGAQLLERLRPLLADAEDVEQLFHGSQREAAGLVRVDVPSRIARRLVAPALPALLRRHPRLQLMLGSSDRAVDLVQDGVDCALRAGVLDDSSLVVRPLGQLALINCASAGYVREHGTPSAPDALGAGHHAIGYAAPSGGRELPWAYVDAAGTTRTLALASRVIVNNAESYIAACRAGAGLIQVPRFDVQHLLDRGELVELLPQHRPPPLPVSLLYPHRRQRSRRLVVVVEWLSALMAPHLEARQG
jgi:DNA-binding transcriptional LysR family regulator